VGCGTGAGLGAAAAVGRARGPGTGTGQLCPRSTAICGRILSPMGWLASLKQKLDAFDDAEWPDGVAWPEGRPTELERFRSTLRFTSLVPIAAGAAIFALDLPFGVGLVVFVVVLAGDAGYIVREINREARRQGWGRNLGW
jgi:hypothetical protein